MLKTAEFATRFIISPKKLQQDTSHILPPSVILREQEEIKIMQASQKSTRKRTQLEAFRAAANNSITSVHLSETRARRLPNCNIYQ